MLSSAPHSERNPFKLNSAKSILFPRADIALLCLSPASVYKPITVRKFALVNQLSSFSKMGSRDSGHVLLLPMPIFGHITPMLELGRKLSGRHHVTLGVSSIRIEQLRTKGILTGDDEATMSFHGIHDGAEDFEIDDPKFHEKMKNNFMLIFGAIGKLMQQMPVRSNPESATGITKPVDFVIADGFLAGPASSCTERGVGFIQFQSTSTSMKNNNI